MAGAGGWRGWSWPHERTHTTGNATGKEAKIDLPWPRVPRRYAFYSFSSCCFPLRRVHLALRSRASFPRCCGRGTKGRRRRFFGETRRLIIVRSAVPLEWKRVFVLSIFPKFSLVLMHSWKGQASRGRSIIKFGCTVFLKSSILDIGNLCLTEFFMLLRT